MRTECPRQPCRDVAADRGGDEHLFESFDGVGESIATRLIQFGEHVIENEHRVPGS